MLGVDPARTLMVGDTPADAGAVRAGCAALVLPAADPGGVNGLSAAVAPGRRLRLTAQPASAQQAQRARRDRSTVTGSGDRALAVGVRGDAVGLDPDPRAPGSVVTRGSVDVGAARRAAA